VRKKEYNKYSMYKTVLAFFKSCEEKLNLIPALKQSVRTLSDLIALIVELDLQYTTVSKGATSHKKEMRARLISDTEMFCGVLFTYGKKTGDAHIEEVANIKIRTLKKMRDHALLSMARTIFNILNNVCVPLAEYGITGNMITDYAELIDGYDESLRNASSCKIKSITARKRLTETFAEIDTLFRDDLDRLMKLIPEDYGKYQVSRKVIHTGVRHKTSKVDNPGEESVSEQTSSAIFQTDLFS
jgi:hypothetical protein